MHIAQGLPYAQCLVWLATGKPYRALASMEHGELLPGHVHS